MNRTRQDGVAGLAAVLGHELRNPLASAMTGAALVRDMLDQDDPRAALVDGVLRDLERTARLLSSHLDRARNRHAPRLPVDIGRICQAVAARNPDVVRCEGAFDATVAGDADLLERALENMIENALQAGARSVTLRGACREDRALLRVVDDGPGVPAHLQHRIFEAGFSGHGSTGLGLGIVADTVRAHGGSVCCEPVAAGACFRIELPALQLHCGVTA